MMNDEDLKEMTEVARTLFAMAVFATGQAQTAEEAYDMAVPFLERMCREIRSSL